MDDLSAAMLRDGYSAPHAGRAYSWFDSGDGMVKERWSPSDGVWKLLAR
jgi:hypothetical protein